MIAQNRPGERLCTKKQHPADIRRNRSRKRAQNTTIEAFCKYCYIPHCWDRQVSAQVDISGRLDGEGLSPGNTADSKKPQTPSRDANTSRRLWHQNWQTGVTAQWPRRPAWTPHDHRADRV